MSKTKPYRLVVKKLKANGWVLDHTTGSHEIYVKDGYASCPVKCTKKDRYPSRYFDEHRAYNRTKILVLLRLHIS